MNDESDQQFLAGYEVKETYEELVELWTLYQEVESLWKLNHNKVDGFPIFNFAQFIEFLKLHTK